MVIKWWLFISKTIILSGVPNISGYENTKQKKFTIFPLSVHWMSYVEDAEDRWAFLACFFFFFKSHEGHTKCFLYLASTVGSECYTFILTGKKKNDKSLFINFPFLTLIALKAHLNLFHFSQRCKMLIFLWLLMVLETWVLRENQTLPSHMPLPGFNPELQRWEVSLLTTTLSRSLNFMVDLRERCLHSGAPLYQQLPSKTTTNINSLKCYNCLLSGLCLTF